MKYAKPASVIASLIPTTNPEFTAPGTAIYALKAKDAVIFSPHPRSKATTFETVRIMREALKKLGAPEDLFQCIRTPSIPVTQELMAVCDLTMATGGKPMVTAAYSSGKPAYGVGAGNSTMVIDETTNIGEAARNTRISKTSDFGSGCSADGNRDCRSVHLRRVARTASGRGRLPVLGRREGEGGAGLVGRRGHRTSNTVAIAAQKIAEIAGFSIPEDRKFIIVQQDKIGRAHKFSGEKLCVVLAMYKYNGFEQAIDIVRQIYEVGGKGHSCGIYSFDDNHIDRLARVAPVSRMMVRQPQSKANADAFNNGMPMTSSLECGIWGATSPTITST